MRRALVFVAAAASVVALASTASAAPKPTNNPLDPTDIGNHPLFPVSCTGGIFGDDPVSGVVVQANGGSDLANGGGSLPTAFFTAADGTTVLGLSMYREVYDDTDHEMFDEAARGNTTLDQVMARWNVSECVTGPLPGSLLNLIYPNAEFDDTHFYIFTNYVKPAASSSIS